MIQAVTLVDIRSAHIPAGTRVSVMSEENHDWETGRLRISYNMATYLVPERMLEVIPNEIHHTPAVAAVSPGT